MAIALEFASLGRKVLVLESGGKEPSAESSAASRAEIRDPAHHAQMELTVCRALGGTSWTWGGRCVSYDAVDWLERSYVPGSRWPVGPEVVTPWFERAAEYLLCGSGNFTKPYRRPLSEGLTVETIERWTQESRVILAHRERLLGSSEIEISLHSTVTGIELDAAGQRVASLCVQTPGGERKVRAKHFILALGGVETTRLLLHAQQSNPQHYGGIDGPLGRYYMGHISGKIANIIFAHPEEVSDLDFVKDDCGAYCRRRFQLTAEALVQHQLLNTAFWPDNPPFYDPSHGSGVLSSVFLALAFPPTGRRLLPEAIRLAHTGPRPYPWGAHLKNAILGAPQGAADIYKILRDRFLGKPKKPGFLVLNRGGKYALHYHAEQIPQAQSRITLSAERDAFGVPRASIDLRYTEQDIRSVIDSHKLLGRALEANGIGRLEWMYDEAQLPEHVYEQATDGYHQVGTTRMGTDPAQSVVDGQLKVHGLSNLHLASSSVFPTTGQANSTFLAVAFALRLVHHLHESAASEHDAA